MGPEKADVNSAHRAGVGGSGGMEKSKPEAGARPPH